MGHSASAEGSLLALRDAVKGCRANQAKSAGSDGRDKPRGYCLPTKQHDGPSVHRQHPVLSAGHPHQTLKRQQLVLIFRR
jgi:hypothetical protein